MVEREIFLLGSQHFPFQSQPCQRSTEVRKNISKSADPVSRARASHHCTCPKWQWTCRQHPYMLCRDSSGPCHFLSSSSWCWKESFSFSEGSLFSLQEHIYIAYRCHTFTCKYNLGGINCEIHPSLWTVQTTEMSSCWMKSGEVDCTQSHSLLIWPDNKGCFWLWVSWKKISNIFSHTGGLKLVHLGA